MVACPYRLLCPIAAWDAMADPLKLKKNGMMDDKTLNDSRLFPDDKSTFAIPEALFRRTSKLLRTAEYDDPFLFKVALPELEKFSRELLRKTKTDFTEREAVYYLWSLCLQAELHDYEGRTEVAHRILEKTGEDLEKRLKDGNLGTSATPGFSKRLFRQQLWTLIFWSHCYYRNEKRLNHLIAAKSLLKKIQRQVHHKLLLDADQENREPSFGILARAAYSLGQVYRQLSEVRLARREFMAAIEFTRKRLQAKSVKYARYKPDRIREEVYARYVIAKAFSFGLAWASYHSGELHRARGSAAGGCTLLETTHDPVHKAYAQVIYAGVLSAVSRPVREGANIPEELREAISMLRPLAKEDKSPLRGVPRFFARARYTLAAALDAAGMHDEAEQHARLIYKSSEAGSRWSLECGVLLARLLLKKQLHTDARRQSDELMRWIVGSSPVAADVRFAVLLCHADVLMNAKSDNYDEAQDLLNQAKVLARTSPLSRALCHLYQARCYRLRGMMDAAHVQLSRWRAMESSIEHGYVHELADTVKREMDIDDARLVIDSSLFYKEGGFKEVETRYKEWLIRRFHANHPHALPADEECKRALGIGKRTVELWMKQIVFNPWRVGTNSKRS